MKKVNIKVFNIKKKIFNFIKISDKIKGYFYNPLHLYYLKNN